MSLKGCTNAIMVAARRTRFHVPQVPGEEIVTVRFDRQAVSCSKDQGLKGPSQLDRRGDHGSCVLDKDTVYSISDAPEPIFLGILGNVSVEIVNKLKMLLWACIFGYLTHLCEDSVTVIETVTL